MAARQPACARGTGIRVIQRWSQLPKKKQLIVQRYVSRPYLIEDRKFDLRIYVYVTSFHPLRVYIHDDGLVRFASGEWPAPPAQTGFCDGRFCPHWCPSGVMLI